MCLYLISLLLGVFLLINVQARSLKSVSQGNVSQVTPDMTLLQKSFAWTDLAFCPPNSFVSGLALVHKVTEGVKSTKKGSRNTRSSKEIVTAWGVNLTCSFVDPVNPDVSGSLFPPANSSSAVQDYATAVGKSCEPTFSGDERSFGFVVGIEKGFSIGAKRLAMVNTFCNYEDQVTKEVALGRNFGARDVRWEPQSFCPWGKYACGVKLRYAYDVNSLELVDLRTECCELLTEKLGWKNYRGETAGRVVSSIPLIDVQTLERRYPDVHFASQLDDPYYFNWEFCPVGAYVTGLQGQLARRLFRLSCSDVSQPAPRVTTFIETSLSASQWEEEELSVHVKCEGGVVIGLQVLYGTKSLEIQGLRLICSHSMESRDTLPYVKVLFPAVANGTDSVWGDAQMCRRGEAVCGWKPREVKDKFGVPMKTDHVKVKCCRVPPMGEICAPHDAFELLLECDARDAMAETTCQYTLTEGFTVSTTSSEHHSRSNNLRNALNEEWSIAEAATLRNSTDHGISTSNGGSQGESETNTKTEGTSLSNATSNGRSSSTSDGVTNSASSSDTAGTTWTQNVNKAFDLNSAISQSATFSDTFGISGGSSNTQTSGRSQNFLNTRSSGRGFSDSTSDVVGSSTGSMASTTASRGQSSSFGRTHGSSDSESTTDERSESRGFSASKTEGGSSDMEAHAGFSFWGISAGVRTSVQESYSATMGTTSDSSQRTSKTRSRETSESATSQHANEQSNSNTAQETNESSKSHTKGRTSEVNEQNSYAMGGDSSNQHSVVATEERNRANTAGIGKESSASKSNRTEEGRSLQGSSHRSNENGQSTVSQKGDEVSRNNELRVSREDSDTASIARTKEATFSHTGTFSTSKSHEGSKTRSGGGGKQREKQFTTGFDWTKTSESTWRRERAYQVTMTVPPGYRSRLFQVVGYCAHFQVRTNNYKRIDEVAEWAKEKEAGGPPPELLQGPAQDSSSSAE